MTDALSNSSTYSNSVNTKGIKLLGAKRKHPRIEVMMKNYKNESNSHFGIQLNKSLFVKKENNQFIIELNKSDDNRTETETESDEELQTPNNINFSTSDKDFRINKNLPSNHKEKSNLIEIPIYDKANKNFPQNKLNNNLIEKFLKAKKHIWRFTKNQTTLSFKDSKPKEQKTNPFEIKFDFSSFNFPNCNRDEQSDKEYKMEFNSLCYD